MLTVLTGLVADVGQNRKEMKEWQLMELGMEVVRVREDRVEEEGIEIPVGVPVEVLEKVKVVVAVKVQEEKHD